MTMTTDLQAFILEEITPGRAIVAVDRDDDLLAGGIIDSLAVSQLIEFLQDRYGVSVGIDDLVPANFQSVRAIEAFVERKRSTAAC